MKCNKIKLSSILFFVFVIFCNQTFAQMNNGIFFQAVARDNYSNPAKDRKIYVQSSIIQGSETGIKVLIEDHQTNTDATGVFGISIGLGTRKGGTVTNLNAVEWTKGPYYLNLKIAISPVAPAADWDYTKEWIDLGTTAFGTVPYALFAGSVAGFDAKLNSIDTAKMLLPYARVANLNTLVTNKVNVADSITKYVTPTQLASKTFDSTAIYRTIGTKLNIADSITKYVTPAQLAAKTFDSTAIYNQLALKATTTDVNTSLALKANTTDVTTSLNLKENLNNKSIDVSADGTSDTKYPSAKAVKTFVESSITNSTVPDATALVKGKIQLTGDLTGTSASPSIATGAVTTSKINDGAVTDVKIATVSGSKVTGNITGNAANITGNLAIVNGGTGATTAAGARTNLGLVIGTDVQAPLSFSAPINKNGNTVSINQATTSVDGYLSAADFTSFNNKIDATQKAANNGVATLGNDGKIPSNQIPAISFQSANVVADQTAMLAISGAQVGSIAIRTDNNRNYVLSALPASTLSNWVQLAVPSSVTSVNGSAGPNVVLTTNDVAEGSTNKYYTDARVRGAINASTPLSFNSSTGTISMTAATASSNGYLTSTDFTTFNNKQNAITAGVDYLAPNGSAANLTNFPTLNQNTTGNAATATKLATSRNINGVAFDGSANITVPADGSTLSGSTLASNITASSLTSVGTITSGVWSGTTIAIAKGGTGATTATAALTNLGAEPTANKSTATDLGALNPSDVLFPSQKAVKTYVDLQSANAGVADGSITNAKLAGSITANKLVGTDITTVGTITTGTWSGTTIALNKGGTGATTAAGARTNLGLVIGTDVMAANATTTLTGDLTGTGSGTFTTTLANSGVTANTYGSSTAIPVLTVDVKGRVTNASTVGIIAGVNTLTYTTGTSYANGGTISGTTLTLAAADGTNPGLISTGAQTIAGAKTFSSNVTAPTFVGNLSGNATTATTATSATTAGNITATSNTTLTSLANLTTVGTITSGTWSGSVIGSNVGGAGAVNGLMKANGSGVVSAAVGGTDFIIPNSAITGSTKTKITYDAKGLVTAGADATTADIAPSTNRNYVTDAQTGVLSNTSGVNTGDETTATIKSKLGISTLSGSNTGDQTITLTGDVTGTGTGTFTTTLSNSGVTANTYGSSTAIPVLTVDAKGRVTSAAEVGIIAGVNTLTYTTGTTYANGGTVSGTTLTLAAADGNNPGLISTGAQTIAGAKTFSSNVTASTFVGNLSGTANTATNIAGGVSGSIPYQTAAGTTAMIPNGQANQILTATGSGTYTWTSVSNVTGNSVPYTGATGAVNLGAYDLTVNGLTVGTGVNGSTLSNTAFGYNALAGNNSGSGKNTGIGYAALNKNTTGQLNTAVGYNALLNVVTTIGSTAIGAQALEKNIATGNTAVGTTAGYFLDNLAFQNNSFLGYGSGGRARGAYNIGIGYLALEMRNSGSSLTGADRNIAIGNSTMSLATRPVSNVVIGDNAGPAITFGSWNTILGQQSGKDITEGYHNTFIGDSTGLGITTGSNNVIVGSKVSGLSSTLTGNIILADGAGNIRAQHDGTNGWNLGTITSGTWSGTAIAIANGGTGSNTAAGARTNLGLGSLATKSTIANADVVSGAAIDFAKLNITKADITGLGVQEGLTAGSGISISSGTISVTGLTSSNLSSTAGITNAQLANSSTTLGSTTMTLGGTVTSVTGLTSLNTTNLTSTNITGTLSGTATGLATGRTISTTGDVTYTSGAFDGTSNVTGTATLTNTTVTNGSYGSSTAIPTFTVDSKGRLTAASTASIIADAGTLTGTTLNSTVTSSSLTGVGTITQGTWSGTAISIAKGGTGATTKSAAFDALSPMTTSGDIIYGGTSGTGTRLGVGTTGQVLTVSGGVPTWATPTGISTLTAIGATPNANGGTISGTSFNLQPASANFGGVVTTATQTFAGAKTFNSDIIANELTIGKGLYTATNSTNTAFGISALAATTNLSNSNVGVGYFAMNANTSGTENTAVGNNALKFNTTGLRNTAVGSGAMENAVPGGSNVAQNTSIGAGSLNDLITGNSNTVVGYNGGSNLTSGSDNVLIGNGAVSGSTLLNISNSIIIGSNAGPAATGETNEIVIGNGATGLGSNSILIGTGSTTRARIFGDLELPRTTISTSTSTGALRVSGGVGIAGALNAGGNISALSFNGMNVGAVTNAATLGYNTIFGRDAFNTTATGNYNTVVGEEALKANTSGNSNVAMGYRALTKNTSGAYNVALGDRALQNITTNMGNIGIGYAALSALNGSNSTIAIGQDAGGRLTAGEFNIFIGPSSGQYVGSSTTANTTSKWSTLIGYDTRGSADGNVNEVVLAGYNGGSTGAVGLGSNTTLIGNSSTTLTQLMGALNLPNTTTSTSTTTGALRVGGGAGIVGTLNVGGATTITGAATISNTTTSSSTTTGALIVSGGTGIAGNVNIGGTLGVTGATTITGAATISNTTTSSSTTTGALIVSGGTGIAGNANIGGTLGVIGATTLTGAATISNTTASSSSTTGALVVRGGVGVAGNLTVGGTIEIDGGSPAVGKVLTSDANGVGSWTYAVGSTVLTSTSNYAITLAEAYVFYNGSTNGAFTIPAAAASNAGKTIVIKNKTAFGITITALSSGTFYIDSANGSATSVSLGIEASNNWIKLVSDGTQWNVFRALF